MPATRARHLPQALAKHVHSIVSSNYQDLAAKLDMP